MLNLKKHNSVGLGDCQILATCLACFGKRKHDESDKNENVMKLKWSMMSTHHRNLVEDTMLKKRHQCWRKHAVGDFMTSEHRMSDVAIAQLCTMLNQKICVFQPIKEPSMIG